MSATMCVKLGNKWGLHARTSFALASSSGKFESNIIIEKDGFQADSKIMADLLMLCAECGDTIRISATGKDEDIALDEIVKLIESRFGEQ